MSYQVLGFVRSTFWEVVRKGVKYTVIHSTFILGMLLWRETKTKENNGGRFRFVFIRSRTCHSRLPTVQDATRRESASGLGVPLSSYPRICESSLSVHARKEV